MLPAHTTLPILLARIDGTQVGFPALAVREIVRAVALAPFPGAPAIIEGAVNLRGRIVPVVDLRHRLGLPASVVAPEQYLVALETAARVIAIRVDDVEDITEVLESSLEPPASVSPVLERLRGVAATESGALVIYDVDAFLTHAEQDALDLIASVAE
jgi:purine-binding chemotaxis protein CheW